jgi:hypothetical protein
VRRVNRTLVPLLTAVAVWIILALLPGLPVHAGQDQEGPGFKVSLKRWDAAERLFRSDSRWLGGDGASSVDLGRARALWLFGDSFIDASGKGSRRDAEMVRNSIAIQSGRDPRTASMKFFWKTNNGRPASFFPEEDKEWLWPGSGSLARGVLIIFLVKVRASESELGFKPSGWNALLVDNPSTSPGRWRPRPLVCPRTGRVLVGSSSILVRDGFLHAFGTDWKDNAVYLVRWPLHDVCRGRLLRPQWWMGVSGGWALSLPENARPMPVFTGAQVEFTVHYEPGLKGFLAVQTLSLTEPCLSVRFSPVLTGPWTAPRCIYQPGEKDTPGLLVYAGKAHKVFSGTKTAFTYAVNTLDQERILNDRDIYYPRVLWGRVTALKARP